MSRLQDAFCALAGRVERATTMADLQSAVRSTVEPFGLRHAVYHMMSLPGVSLDNPVLAFTYDPVWVEHYLKRNYAALDPVYLAGSRSVLPVEWEMLDRGPKRVRDFFEESIDAGVGRTGISIPVRGPHGDQALFTVTSDLVGTDWAAFKRENMGDIQLLAHYVHARYLAMTINKNEIVPDLSPREIDVLTWAAVGKSAVETGVILGLSFRTVDAYLVSARHKLTSITKTQAVAKALRLGIIRP